MSGARSIFGLAREGIGLSARNRAFEGLFRDHSRRRRAAPSGEDYRQNPDSGSGVGGHAVPHIRAPRDGGASGANPAGGPSVAATRYAGRYQTNPAARKSETTADRGLRGLTLGGRRNPGTP